MTLVHWAQVIALIAQAVAIVFVYYYSKKTQRDINAFLDEFEKGLKKGREQ